MKKCPLCTSSNTYLKFKLVFDVSKCKNCGFEFCADATFKKGHFETVDENLREKALINLRKENFGKIIKSIHLHLKEEVNGLEIGPGYGWFLEICKENKIDCEGIEPETRFNELYKSNDLQVINGFYPNDLPSDKKYSFIIFNDVIEHLPDIHNVMKSNYELTKPNGIVIINLPIREGIIYFISKMSYYLGIKSIMDRMWQFNFHSPHLSYFSKKNMIQLAKNNNFELINSYKLKTINFSEIYSRISQDKDQWFLTKYFKIVTIICLFPVINLLPDTYCFVLKKKT